MKATVCELPNDPEALNNVWVELIKHVATQKSDLVVLPEMPFFRWLPHTKEVNAAQWDEAIHSHQKWIGRFEELGSATIISTRPVSADGERRNVGYIWEPRKGILDTHVKFYLPDEPGFWEATWYKRGNGEFLSTSTNHCNVGFLICTELWFNSHARAYGKQGVEVLVCPRGTPSPSTKKWIAGGQTAAVVAGAYCLSSNLVGKTLEGCDFGGKGWIIDPEGSVIGLTSAEQTFVTLDLDLEEANSAKNTYPRYILD